MTQLVEGRFNVNNHAHIIKGTKKCLTKWFHHFFCHRDITFYLTRQGAGRFKLNKAALLNLPILIPQTDEQKTIIKILDNFSNALVNKIQILNKLKVIKNGLMQDLLTENAEPRISNLL